MQPRRPITVVIARFEDLVGRGLRAFVEDDGTLSLSAADIAPEDLDRVLAGICPRVAVVNFGSLGCAADVHRICADHPTTRLIVLANRPTATEAGQLLAFGATACLGKETQARDILNAIHLADRGLKVLPQAPDAGVGADAAGLLRADRQRDGPDLLTPREADVLARLHEGRSNAEIAGLLCVGVETVRTHRRNIYRKLGVRTRRELASLTVRAS